MYAWKTEMCFICMYTNAAVFNIGVYVHKYTKILEVSLFA